LRSQEKCQDGEGEVLLVPSSVSYYYHSATETKAECKSAVADR
jgi:hypothetical protein